MSGSSSTRDDLVRAGVELLDQLPWSGSLAGVTTAAVAEQAGVTTGSFFHHFRNSSRYTGYGGALLRPERWSNGTPSVT